LELPPGVQGILFPAMRIRNTTRVWGAQDDTVFLYNNADLPFQAEGVGSGWRRLWACGLADL